MQVTKEQRDAWRDNPETAEWEAVIGPRYKLVDGTADVEKLFQIAELNGLLGLRERYGALNSGQIVMNIRNQLRPMWRANKLKFDR